jgi:hypothetical protein
MKRIRILILSASAVAGVSLLSGAWTGPVRANYGPSYSAPQGYGDVTTAEIVSRVGEILAAIDSPQLKTKLAEQWLQFARQTIERDLQLRENWLRFQKQQLSEQQELEQLRLQVAQLQLKVEQLRAENLRLEQASAHSPGAGAEKSRPPAPSGSSF